MGRPAAFLCALILATSVSCGGDDEPTPMGTGLARCGDGQVDPDEACDDGNNDLGDYCSSTCVKITGRCGDGIVQRGLEVCDPGGACGDRFCSADCQTYTGECGDGIKQSPEQCDDGELVAGDGCDPSCRLEGGQFMCSGSACGPTNCI